MTERKLMAASRLIAEAAGHKLGPWRAIPRDPNPDATPVPAHHEATCATCGNILDTLSFARRLREGEARCELCNP